MKTRIHVVSTSLLVAAATSFHSSQSQIVITSQDFFNQVGLYYKAYANKGDVPVAGIIGNTGGPQSWDFTSGPTDDIFEFDYLNPGDDPSGAGFPIAKFAERKTEQSNGKRNYLFLEQVTGVGRKNYGFYDSEFSSTHPSSPFSTPIVDFPDIIRYQDSWSSSTSFETEIVVIDNGGDDEFPVSTSSEDPGEEDPGTGTLAIPAIINYSSTAKVDAYGIINQPGIGFDDCLRVNELVEYNIQVDLFGDGNFQNVSTDFVRNYYWLRNDNGIAVQITSTQQSTPPPDAFSLAAAYVRLFESNHPKGDNPTGGGGIANLRITYGNDRVLLNWTKPATGSSRVEYTADLSKSDGWTTLETTGSNFSVDTNIAGVAERFYRIVGVP